MVRLFMTVQMDPNAGGLPGAKVLQQLTNGLGSWALIAALIGMVIGAAAWALGHYSQNNGAMGLSGTEPVKSRVSGTGWYCVGRGLAHPWPPLRGGT